MNKVLFCDWLSKGETDNGSKEMFRWFEKNGRWMPYTGIEPPVQGIPAHCYQNSYMAAKQLGLKYCEGFYCDNKAGDMMSELIHHAWNLNDKGEVVDTTLWWSDAKHRLYFGAEFDVELYDKQGKTGRFEDHFGKTVGIFNPLNKFSVNDSLLDKYHNKAQNKNVVKI